MVSLVVEAKGIGEVERRLTALVRAGADLTPAMRDIGEHLLNTTRERFVEEEDPEGSAWHPLSEATKARKRRNVDKILTQDAYLRKIVTRASRDSVEVGSPRIYAGTHQFGAEKGSFGSTEGGRRFRSGTFRRDRSSGCRTAIATRLGSSSASSSWGSFGASRPRARPAAAC